MPHLELDRGWLAHRRRPRAEPDFGRAHQCLPPELSENSTRRALTLRTRMLSVMIRAPDHASCCQFGYGLRAYTKITTGRLAMGAARLLLQNWLLSAVNSSGAVSPLMRATASSRPVRMPLRAAGQMTLGIVRQGDAPMAGEAAFIPWGTRGSRCSVVRTGTGM